MGKPRVNDSGLRRRIERIKKQIKETGSAAVDDLIFLGKTKAQQLVPKGRTGWLYKSIKGKKTETNEGAKGRITLDPYIVPVDGVHRRSKGNYPNFNLARWSHTSPRARSHFKSGSPTFMYDTLKYLRDTGLGTAKGRFKNIKL